MTRLVINKCFGGFGLSDEAIKRYGKLSGLDLISEKNSFGCCSWYYITDEGYTHFSVFDIARDDVNLVRVVEEMGEASFTDYSNLKIIEIPDDVQYTIEDYDGKERVAEVHQTWG